MRYAVTILGVFTRSGVLTRRLRRHVELLEDPLGEGLGLDRHGDDVAFAWTRFAHAPPPHDQPALMSNSTSSNTWCCHLLARLHLLQDVEFDINAGWSWGGGAWAKRVQANADIVPMLIESKALSQRVLQKLNVAPEAAREHSAAREHAENGHGVSHGAVLEA